MASSSPSTSHLTPPSPRDASKSRDTLVTTASEDGATLNDAAGRANVRYDKTEKADYSSGSNDEKATTITPVSQSPAVEDEYPEGGRGWWVVLGSFLLTTCTLGVVNTWVYQSLYEEFVLPDSNPSAIAWIGSLQYSLTLMPGLISGRLFDIGYLHTPLLVASIVLVLCTILTAECTTYVHFLVTQGIITGLASAFVFGPAMPIISHWFKKRRSSGIGVAIAGASFGGTILPIIVRQLIPVVGRKWTMRIVGLILFVFLGAANLLIRRRLPPVRVRGGLINPAAFKQASYSIYCLGTFIGFLGLYTPLTFLDVSAIESAHLSPGFSFYLISIANASSTIGRVGGGFLSDKLGCLNVLIPSDIVAAAITFAWPYCATKVGLINVAVFFGIAFGTSVGLFTAPIAHLGDPSDIGRRTGMLYTLVSISSLIGPPISGAIFSKSGGFQGVGIYAGCTILCSGFIALAAKIAAVGSWRGKF